MLTYPKTILYIFQLCFSTVLAKMAVAGDLKVTLAMFSGLEDPQWVIPTTSEAYKDVKVYLDQAIQKGLTFSSGDMPPKLGYRGFLVKEGTGPERLIVGPNTIPLQLRLLDTAPTTILLEGDRQDIAEEISSGAVIAEISGRKARRWAPPYEPSQWQTERRRLCNNCYNYATMRATDNFAQPGRGSGQPFHPRFFRGQDVKEAAQRDGLEVYDPPLGSGEVRRFPLEGKHLVALVVRDDTYKRRGDFHWYRLDKNPGVRPDPDGFWSHKQGESHVTDRDNQRQRITDPSKLDPLKNHGYEFVAFMTVSLSDNLKLQGPLNCDQRLKEEHESEAPSW